MDDFVPPGNSSNDELAMTSQEFPMDPAPAVIYLELVPDPTGSWLWCRRRTALARHFERDY